MKFYKYGEVAPYKHIFVFGSNLAGRHGAGAAKFALRYHGAIYGNPRGIQGNSYAIPTKDKKLETLPLGKIKPEVDQFIEFVISHTNLNFFITRIGCGLAGYKDHQIAPMFKDLAAQSNVVFPEAWKYYLLLP